MGDPVMIRGMTHAARTLQTATMAALDIADTGDVPEWVHLLPTAEGQAETQDDRGPYHVTDAAAIIAASFADQTKLQIDENHAEDLASPKGEPSPARGWITALEARADGIWGKVEWTRSGHRLVRDRAYRAMSPVILHDKTKKVFAILRASLVNRPNFRGLAALHQEHTMGPMAKMAAALGLGEDASEDAILSAITALKKKPDAEKGGGETAMQSAMAAIGVALGVEGEAKPDVVLAAAKLAAGGKDGMVALQAENAGLKTRIDAIETASKKAASEAYVRGEMAKGRLIPANAVEDMISLHIENPALAVKMVEGTVMGRTTHTSALPPTTNDPVMLSLNAEQQGVEIANRAKAYQAERAKAGTPVEFAVAVQHISEKLK